MKLHNNKTPHFSFLALIVTFLLAGHSFAKKDHALKNSDDAQIVVPTTGDDYDTAPAVKDDKKDSFDDDLAGLDDILDESDDDDIAADKDQPTVNPIIVDHSSMMFANEGVYTELAYVIGTGMLTVEREDALTGRKSTAQYAVMKDGSITLNPFTKVPQDLQKNATFDYDLYELNTGSLVIKDAFGTTTYSTKDGIFFMSLASLTPHAEEEQQAQK